MGAIVGGSVGGAIFLLLLVCILIGICIAIAAASAYKRKREPPTVIPNATAARWEVSNSTGPKDPEDIAHQPEVNLEFPENKEDMAIANTHASADSPPPVFHDGPPPYSNPIYQSVN